MKKAIAILLALMLILRRKGQGHTHPRAYGSPHAGSRAYGSACAH